MDQDSPTPFPVTATGAPGISPARLRHRRYAAPTRGVRLPAGVDVTPLLRDRAGALAASGPVVLVDASAARHWGLPLPSRLESTRTALAVETDGSRVRRSGMRGRRLLLPTQHLMSVGDLLVTTPARTWLDCAELLDLPSQVAMGDALLRRGLADQRGLAGIVAWGRGRRGVATARRALGLLDAGSESPRESIVRVLLVTRGVPRPECNVDIVVDGEWLARADLMWRRERVIVEYDGATHGEEARRRSDAVRRNLLQDRGWQVIVFTARDVAHPEQMAALVLSALRSRR